MRNFGKALMTVAAVAALSLPALAKTDSEILTLDQPTQVGTSQLDKGTYEIHATEGADHFTVTKDGKKVADIPCTWVQLEKKPTTSTVQKANGRVTEIDFGGKTQAIHIQ
jgi:hypothetical protein